MRLWSLHPQYLDAQGLVALWREALLAHRVLSGKTKGYTNHPQLHRFKEQIDPVAFLNTYLAVIAEEAAKRGYTFDVTKIPPERTGETMVVTDGQLTYEWQHLLTKLERRDPVRHAKFRGDTDITPHPLFLIIPGGIAPWEKQ